MILATIFGTRYDDNRLEYVFGSNIDSNVETQSQAGKFQRHNSSTTLYNFEIHVGMHTKAW